MAAVSQQRGPLAVALSGGVDSAVSCHLLQEQGYELLALFMDLGQPDLAQQQDRAEAMASFLGLQLQVVNLQAAFKDKVLSYFQHSYFQGRTPNPCVVCNPLVKCGLLLEHALALGCQGMATGHYVRRQQQHGHFILRQGRDPRKDQSYFLCGLSQQQLAALHFPLGDYLKTEVYQLAASYGLPDPGGESQDICFLTGSLADYFAGQPHLPPPGDIVDSSGQVLGRHRGIHLYTIGQRRGLGIPAKHPLYVVGLDGSKNQVVVGLDEELWHDCLQVKRVNWLAGQPPTLPLSCQVKIRYRHSACPAMVEQAGDGLLVRFAEKQRAVTPGQFAAFYDDDLLLGGGEII